jgi:hypothetical protein
MEDGTYTNTKWGTPDASYPKDGETFTAKKV